MKLALVCYKDTKSEDLLPPFTERNPAIAVRNFQDACQNQQSIFAKHPEDYCLLLIGEIDTEKQTIKPYIYEEETNGKIVIVNKAKVLAEATSFVIKGEKNDEKV